jgi:hypothetical protein
VLNDDIKTQSAQPPKRLKGKVQPGTVHAVPEGEYRYNSSTLVGMGD